MSETTHDFPSNLIRRFLAPLYPTDETYLYNAHDESVTLYDILSYLENSIALLDPGLIEADLNALDARLDIVEPALTTAQGNITTLQGQVTALEAEDISLDSRLDIAESDIASAEIDIAALFAADVVLDGRLDTVEPIVTALDAGKLVSIYKSVTTGRASTTALTDDPHLTLPVVANGIYALNGFFKVTGITAADFKFDLSVPALATANYLVLFTYSDSGTPLNVNITDGINNNIPINGVLVVGANAGNITVQWAQVASNATPTVLHEGSWLRLQKLN